MFGRSSAQTVVDVKRNSAIRYFTGVSLSKDSYSLRRMRPQPARAGGESTICVSFCRLLTRLFRPLNRERSWAGIVHQQVCYERIVVLLAESLQQGSVLK